MERLDSHWKSFHILLHWLEQTLILLLQVLKAIPLEFLKDISEITRKITFTNLSNDIPEEFPLDIPF